MVVFENLDLVYINRIIYVKSFYPKPILPNIRLDMGRITPVNSFHAKYDTIDISLKKAEDSTLIYAII